MKSSEDLSETEKNVSNEENTSETFNSEVKRQKSDAVDEKECFMKDGCVSVEKKEEELFKSDKNLEKSEEKLSEEKSEEKLSEEKSEEKLSEEKSEEKLSEEKSEDISNESESDSKVSNKNGNLNDKSNNLTDNLNDKSNNLTENIFIKSGQARKKKESEFLKPPVKAEEEIKKEPKKEKIDGFEAVLSYLQDEEWIPVGKGMVLVKDEKMIFIRDFLKTVIFNVSVKNIEFKKEDMAVTFNCTVKREQGGKIENVQKEYQMEFLSRSQMEEFLMKF